MYLFQYCTLHIKSSGAIPNNPHVRKRECYTYSYMYQIQKLFFRNDLSNPIATDLG